MLSNQLSALLKPYKLLINKHALAATYRAVQLSEGKVLGCSAACILETNVDHGLAETVHVDATSFLAVLDSLPDNQEVKFELTDGVLRWSCGSAKGRLAPLSIDEMPSIPTRRKQRDAFKPTAAFVKGLRMGALSCDSNALLSVGLFGVVIDNRDGLAIHSSDNITVSAAMLGGKIAKAPDKLTLTPDPAALLAELIQADESAIEFDSDGLYYYDKYCRAIIKGVPELKYDTLEMLKQYSSTDTVAPIPPDAIASFIRRAGALADNKRHTYISLSATKGQLSLNFEEGVASAEEYYLVKDLDIPEMPPIHLDASKLARALAHCSEVVLDHLDRTVIVLQGHDPEFRYLIGGRREASSAQAAE